MSNYSIKELETLSGIKAHTIRIWEKRYNILNPERTDTNIRYYRDQDLKKLLNISILYRHGDKISKLSQLDNAQLDERIRDLVDIEHMESHMEQLTICMIEMDEQKFEKHVHQFILKFGFEHTMMEIIFPFLKRIGILWLGNHINPIQEHFISQLIRQKIIVAIDGLPLNKNPSYPRVMFFLPENELHEIGLLFNHYLIRKMGFNTFYLGQHVPLDNLEESVNIYKPDYLVSSFSYSPELDKLGEFMTALSTTFPKAGIYVTGYPLRIYDRPVPENINTFSDSRELMRMFNNLLPEQA